MKKILLYYPPTTIDKLADTDNFPLSVLSLCTLIDTKKYEICIEYGFDDSRNKLLGEVEEAVCLGISIMTGTQIKHAVSLAKQIRARRADLPIVFGGYHASALPEETLMSPYADIVIRGYGEVVFKNLINALENKESLETVEGISFCSGDVICHNKNAPIPKLDNLPSMPYHLLDVQGYFAKNTLRNIPYISSRGCPHQCGFCADYVIYKRRWNALSAERVVNDLSWIKENYSPELIRIIDSNFFVDEKRVIKICKGLLDKKIQLRFTKLNGDAHLMSRFSDETFRLMRDAGIENILIGVESGSAKALACIHKRASKEETLDVSMRLRKGGISIGHSLILGFPYDLPRAQMEEEHRREFIMTMKYVYELNSFRVPGDYYLLFNFTPYPGVSLYERYLKLGYVPPKTLEGWAEINLNTYPTPWLGQRAERWAVDCRKLAYFFSGKCERTWQNYQHFRFQWFLSKPVYDKLVAAVCRAINKLLYKRLNKGLLQMPFPLKAWYGVERFYFHGRRGDQNMRLSTIAVKAIGFYCGLLIDNTKRKLQRG